jgi:amino acid adenylation domain-containing protein
MTEASSSSSKIAIVGRAGRFPAARNVAEFWRLLAEGRVATTQLTDEELLAAGVARDALLDPNYVKVANVLPDMECFDAGFFGFSPKEASILDPQHRHFLECAWEALEDAGHMPKDFPGLIGVFAGSGMQAYLPYNLLSNPQLVKEIGLFLLRHTGNDKDFLPTRLSYLLNLTGPSVAVQTACSTGLVAVHMAVQSLLSGECDMAIAGGVTIELPHRVGYHYAEGEILSPDGLCKAFDDGSEGTVFGSGSGIVVLRRLQDALDDGDDVKAVILGSAINNDGASKAGYLAPSVDGQAAAAATALTLANVEPQTVGYLEAHGTGTPIGDPIELTALTQAYGPGGKRFCGIGSVKSNIGHLDTAAGTASLIKVTEALRRGRIPPSLHCKTPNKRYDWQSGPFFVVDQARDWPRGSTPRRAAINSLGVGGTNAHMIVEEAPLRAPAPVDQKPTWRLFPLSARTRTSLQNTRAKWPQFLADGELPALGDIAFTLQQGRRTFDERLVVAARSHDELRAVMAGQAPSLVHEGTAGSKAPEVVFLFPGGGAQYPGAGVDMLQQSPVFAAAVEQCFAALPKDAPADLRTMMFERPFTDIEARQKIGRSTYAIPALFVLEYAYAKLWESLGVVPDLILAHSVGEYAGACVAGVLSVADAMRIVTLRGRVMDQAPAGAMTTVPASEEVVRSLIGDALDIAALNAPEASVVSGTVEAIEALEKRLLGTDHECKRIRIDVGAHSRVLDGQLEAFRAGFAGVRFQAPKVKMVSSLRGDLGQGSDFASADYWVRHLRHTVRFTQAVGVALQKGNRIVLEVGPGQSLGPLVQMTKAAHKAKAVVYSARKPNEVACDLGVFMTAFGALWTHGVAIDWRKLPSGGRRVSLPTYGFEKQRHWIEPGRGVISVDAATGEKKVAIDRLPELDQWFETVTWVEAPLPSAAAKAPASWLVLANDDALATAVLKALHAGGKQPVVVRPGPAFGKSGDGYTLRPDSIEDHEALFAALGAMPERIVHCGALQQGATAAALFDGGFALVRGIQAADPKTMPRLVFVARGSAPVSGQPVQQPSAAALFGLVAVAPRELPGLEAVLVDVGANDPVADAAARVLDEALANGTPTGRVAWRAGRRFQPRRARTPVAAPAGLPTRLREQGCYVVTGGNGGIGRALCEYLLTRAKAKVAVLSRSARADASLQALAQRSGGDVRFVAADVADREALAKALADVRSAFGAIHGVFHAAGTIDDAPIALKTREQAHAVLAPKATGALNLAALLPEGQLDVFAVFSSSSVTIAPAGQSDYIAANSALEAIAHSRADGLVLAWGVWRDLGMAERAYGTGSSHVANGGHPLLGARSDDPAGEVSWTRRFDPATDWCVGEHIVGDQPVLPGTAYVELAAACAALLAPGKSIEIQSLSLQQPMLFAEGLPRLVTVRCKPMAGGYEFAVDSKVGAAAEAIEHARARLVIAAAADSALPASFGKVANAALAASPRSGRAPQAEKLGFGPRWQNVGALHRGDGVVEGEFMLPEPFVGDIAHFRAHPALLDTAATIGLDLLVDRNEPLVYAPISVERIRLLQPLPTEVHSRAVVTADAPGRMVSFDVVLRDNKGQLVAVLEHLAMRALPQSLLARAPAQSEARLTDLLLARGIRADEAPAVFERALSAPGRHLVVSSVSLDRVRLAIADSGPKAKPKDATADGARTIEAPINPVEQQLADLWAELLGVPAVGRSDDFFALGGHSLNAVRMLGRVRKQLGVDLPLATLFEGPTVRALAVKVAEKRPELLAAAKAEPAAPIAAHAGGANAGSANGRAASAPLQPAASGPETRTCASTEAQREVFGAILIDPGVSRAYNLSFSLHLTGPLEPAPIEQALAALVARHESLRSVFAPDGLSLVIRRDATVALQVEDLSGLDGKAQRERLAQLHERAVEAPFDLLRGPVFRATLITKSKDAREILFVVHHAVCDGWSTGVLMRDFHALLEAARSGQPAKLKPPVGISDFVAAEHAWQQGPEASKHKAFWLSRFAAGAPAMELPADHVRPPVKTTRASRLDDVLDPALEGDLRALAKSLGASLANVVFAAFQLYLGRLTGNKDVVIGLPSSGQLAHDLDGVVGHCVNFLPIKTTIVPTQTFADFVRQSRGDLVASLDHGNFTYGSLVRELRIHRDPSRVALVPVIFNIDNLTDIAGLQFAGLKSSFAMNPRAHEHFELFVNLLDEAGRVHLFWSYNADLFAKNTMAGHVARFRRLLKGLANAPQTALADAGRFLTGVIKPASGTHDDPGANGPQTVTEHFARMVAKFPTRTALRFGSETMDYRTLDQRSDALAALLQQKGVKSGDLVGISSRRALELVVAVLGALKAGAGYVPFDTTLPPDRLAFMAQDTAVKVLLGECEPVTAAGVPTVPFREFPREAGTPQPATVTGASMCYVMFTSGTTGKPKGVVLPHRSVIRMLIDNVWLKLSPDTVTLHSSAFAFDTSIIDLFAALLHGGCVVIPPDGTLSLGQLADSIAGHGVNTLWLTSGLFHAVADMRPQVFEKVQQVIVGGDIVSPVHVRKVVDACPGCTVINGYGPTESNVTNAHTVTRQDLDSGQALPIGPAIHGTQIYIVDENLNPVDAGVQGELVISGRGLALGYWNRPELTAEKFVQAPWDPTLRIYRSGDLAMDPGDGVIRFFGRMDGQVKIRGFRIELGEVEAALESHPQIRQAVVVAVVPEGQTDKVLGAYLLANGAPPERKALVAWLKERLPDYARPALYKVVDAIPLNHNGKVDRRALPKFSAADLAAGDEAPEGPIETRMVAIWCELLGLEQVGAEANFFELGGHSLLAVRLFDQLKKQFDVEMPISTLFQNPTVRTLSAKVQSLQGAPAVPVQAADDWDTTTVIHRGPHGSGEKALFIVGGVGGNVNNLYEIGQKLGRKRPVVGFQTRGILGHAPRTSIEEMAAEHIRYMKVHQPKGPYLVAGYSGGAITAFEIARQLVAAGELLVELFIFDTFAPGFAPDFRPQVKMTVGERLRNEVKMLRDEGVGFLFERASAVMQRKLWSGPARALNKLLRPAVFRLKLVEESWLAAAAKYRGGAYPGTIQLLKTEPRGLKSKLAYAQDPTLGWGSIAGERLRVVRVPGDHLRMIVGTNADAVVAAVEQRIEELGKR